MVNVRKPDSPTRDMEEIRRRQARCGTLPGMVACPAKTVKPLGMGNVNRLNLCEETERPEKGGEVSYLQCIGVKICPRGLD